MAIAIIRVTPRTPPTAPPIIPAIGTDEPDAGGLAEGVALELVLVLEVMLSGTGEPDFKISTLDSNGHTEEVVCEAILPLVPVTDMEDKEVFEV
jgi:hypothetical protein